ncbi:MAG: helix-turn-helix domain-containing protein [Sedimenticolaceae bacterium]
MRSIMLCRAAYLLIYADLAREVGTPVTRELRRAGLPTTLDEFPDSYIPVLQAMNFVHEVESREGINDIGLLAAQRLTCDRLSPCLTGLTSSASTLYDLFCRFAMMIRLENTSAHASMCREKDLVRITIRILGNVEPKKQRYVEWLQAMLPIQLIRHVVGASWSPVELTLRSRFDPGPEVYDTFPETRILVGSRSTSILVPATLMTKAVRHNDDTTPTTEKMPAFSRTLSQRKLDFRESLMLVLRSYVRESHLDVGLAAEIAGTSVRTLQRRLGTLGMNYSHLVQQVRFDAATEMLADPGQRVMDIARAVGYDDQAHFTRAFKRIAGISPTEYRRALHST